MKKIIFLNYLICLILGGLTFWGCFGIVKFITFGQYGGKAVGFLTLFAPLMTWVIIRLWNSKFSANNRESIINAIFIGIVGPLAMTYLYSAIKIIIPAARIGPSFISARDYLSFIGMSIIIGPFSTLTYTGMLGAMILNIISAPIVGWLSGHAKQNP